MITGLEELTNFAVVHKYISSKIKQNPDIMYFTIDNMQAASLLLHFTEYRNLVLMVLTKQKLKKKYVTEVLQLIIKKGKIIQHTQISYYQNSSKDVKKYLPVFVYRENVTDIFLHLSLEHSVLCSNNIHISIYNTPLGGG